MHLQGPLLPLATAPEGSKTFFFGSKASVDIQEYRSLAGVEITQVWFDIEPTFPCWALMVGNKAAILVTLEQDVDEELRSGQSMDGEEKRWVRVGMSDSMYGFEEWWKVAERDKWIKEITIV